MMQKKSVNIVKQLEKEARQAGVCILKARKISGITRSTWHRWRKGSDPKLSTVEKVRAAIRSLQ